MRANLRFILIMSKNDKDSHSNPFRDAFADISPMSQDKHAPYRDNKKKTEERVHKTERSTRKQVSADFHFSDGFEAHFDATGPLKYVKPGADTHEVKRLRRGEYPPDLILDLHGMKRRRRKDRDRCTYFYSEEGTCPLRMHCARYR